ncbi:MAG: hypothetical protein ALECFALPRED_007010 [Alectoria fallacina]|uniref:Uncharacterized protein n=1 Tax=Alectoria fallacina TaxID=1903189 RepID=A0A8H3G995_9LECA|nr:MAG: hypothetical protein ALECFALPRED_007010 [Alectoria fallacina]
MRGRPKKRKSNVQSFETVPNPKKQVVLTTKNLTTIRDKHPPWSAPSMRQQSITQMDALREYYHPDLENEYLKTDDEEADSYVASPTRNKRRKLTPEKPSPRRMETRSVKRQAITKQHSIQKQEDRDVLPSTGAAKSQNLRVKVPTAMLPPKTPTSLRRKEIPSSQSPAETPLSTQSRQSLQDYTRSPLKERSTNIDSSGTSPIKGARWSNILEVADSMETGDEDILVATRIGLTANPVGPATDREELPEEDPPLPSHAFSIHVDDFNKRLEAAQRPVKEIQNSSQARPRHEIIDSTDEEDDDEEVDAFNAGPETQAALASTDVSQKSSDPRPASTPPTSKSAEYEPECPSGQGHASESPTPMNAPSPLAKESNIDDQLPMRKHKKVEFVDLATSDPPESTAPSKPRVHHSDSEEVSAQLFADLRRKKQPGGLQTESQYEIGWTPYTPADDIHSDLELHPSSPQPIEQPSSGLMTVPTQFIRPPISSPPKFYRAPVPPSQATTVDITQPSPRNLSSQAIFTQSSPHNVNNDNEVPSPQAACSSPAFPSSPPPMPPPSSSSLASRKLDPWEGFEWNGVRLTDSQLLPDSLLNDSEVGPPGLSQESLIEEV